MAIAGGGTGGHLFPGIAVAECFRTKDKEGEILFIGTEHGIESRIIPKEGYPIKFIKVEGVLGKSLFSKAAALWKIMRSVLDSREIFRTLRPDVVIGTGGYVSVGPVIAARTMSIPTLIMEQNIVPGFANRFLGRIADAVAITYHEGITFFPKVNTHITGNPIRQMILGGDRQKALELFSLEDGRVTVFIVGGSRGARKINMAMMDALSSLLDERDTIQFLHQTGEEDYENVRKRYREMGFKALVVPFVYQMAEAYAVSDFLISRAGATTIAEITALGKPALLIPYPHATGHQDFNARKLLDIGGCRVMQDRKLTGEALAEEIRMLAGSKELRDEMKWRSQSIGRPDASEKVVGLAMSLVKARSRNV